VPKRSIAKRLLRLCLGLYLYGWGLALLIHAQIGVPPWDVLSQGLQSRLGITFGEAAILTSVAVLLLWIPLKQRVGVGTVLNGISIGPGADLVMPLLPKLDGFGQQLLCLAVGLLVVAIAAGLYISAELGAGPRDGLMVGLTRVSNRPFWVIRTLGEGTVLLTGWLLGGNAGVGTAIFAVSIGHMMQTSMKFFGFDPKSGAKSPKSAKSAGLEAEISSGIE
jgi:uncharacterized membrane protein YczE